MSEKTKIYVIFPTSGLVHRGAWDAEGIRRKVMGNEALLAEIAQKCEGVEFVQVNLIDEERLERISRSHYGTTKEEREFQAETYGIARQRAESALESVRNSPDVDGVLIFGPPPEELIQIGLPIIAVFPMWGTWMAGFDFQGYRGKKVVTSCLPVVRDASEPVFVSRVADIAKKVKIVQAVSRMKRLRILSVTDRPVLGSYENGFGDRKAYERVFLENLEQVLGCEVITIPQAELFDAIWKMGEQEAERIAHTWIEEAAGIKGTNEAEIVKSARVYLAMKALMARYDCGAITTEGYGVFADYEKGPIPSQGLASSQLYTDGTTATSECLLNSLFTQHLGLDITGRPGFNGDYIIDPFNQIAVVGHCEGALNPYGDERKSSYVIRNLPRWKKNEGGACVQIDFPLNETVTLAKISMHDKKLALSAGKTVSGRRFFEDWNDLACRTKIAVETNTQALLENLNWQTFGVHRVAFYGDFRQEFKDLAALIGFEVVEENK